MTARILFVVPLRIACSRAKSRQQESTIVTMLVNIPRRGFVVVHAPVLDPKDVWDKRYIEISIES